MKADPNTTSRGGHRTSLGCRARLSAAILMAVLGIGCSQTALEGDRARQTGLNEGESPRSEIQAVSALPEDFLTAEQPAGDMTVLPELLLPVDALSRLLSSESAGEQSQAYHRRQVGALCEEIGGKLGSISVADCLAQDLRYAGAYSVNARPLTLRDYESANGSESPRILIMGGIHGDEYSSISIMFKWMELLSEEGSAFYWRFLPSVNPDGLLDGEAVRQNARGVDLNRNFPSGDWFDLARDYWRDTGYNPRRFPGDEPGSEPEIRWLVEQIEVFRPTVIVSVHAPYHLLDFDGPAQAPAKIGELYLHQLGVYPGSLGNYAGVDLGIPVITLELPSAGIMPSARNIEAMWRDLNSWLENHHRQELISLSASL